MADVIRSRSESLALIDAEGSQLSKQLSMSLQKTLQASANKQTGAAASKVQEMLAKQNQKKQETAAPQKGNKSQTRASSGAPSPRGQRENSTGSGGRILNIQN